MVCQFTLCVVCVKNFLSWPIYFLLLEHNSLKHIDIINFITMFEKNSVIKSFFRLIR